MPEEHKDKVRKAFDKQSSIYHKMPIASSNENVAPMIDLTMPGPMETVLDLACGAGFVGLSFAPYVKHVTGIDLSQKMLKVAHDLAEERGVKNVTFKEGDVEDLPFPDGTFDIVTSRFTFHHFNNPVRVLSEIKRVGRPMSRIVIYDMVASPEDDKADLHNEIELARDPSHVRMLQDKEWRDLFAKAGFEVRSKISVLMKRDFEPWMDIVQPDDALRARVRGMMEKAADNNSAGLGVRVRDGQIHFTHTCAIWLIVQK